MEEFFTLQNNNEEQIFAVLHHAEAGHLADDVMIIFLHGFAGYRIGPHRMFVKYARKLAQKGYSCLRFDFRGRGFSDGKPEDTSTASMLADLNIVLDYIDSKYKLEHLILFGICMGSNVAMYATGGSKKIDHIIALSSFSLWQQHVGKSEVARTRAILQEYFRKLFLWATWKKLFSGRLNISLIIDIIFKPLIRYYYSLKNRISHNKATNSSNDSTIGQVEENVDQEFRVQLFSNFRGEILLIHGEKDPETNIATGQISTMCRQLNIAHSIHIIPGANHSFYSLKWEKEIYQLVEGWLDQKYKTGSHRK